MLFPLYAFVIAAQASLPPPAPIAARLHYRAVETELLARDVNHLSRTQRMRRAWLIELLAEYRSAGRFGRVDATGGERVFAFIDEGGRRCAVAHLLDATGAETLAHAVAAERNDTFVAELAHEERFLTWLSDWGLSLTEAARIQFPGQNRPPLRVGTSADLVGTLTGGGRTDAGASRPTAPAATRGGQDSGPSIPGRSTNNPESPGPAGAPLGWQEWWLANRAAYLRPNALRRGAYPATPGPEGVRANGAAGWEHSEWVATFGALLDDDLSPIRSAATLALGRIGGADDVPALIAQLDDPQVRVRTDALLALGANASPRAVHALLEVARTGAGPGRPASERVTALARPISIVGLGLARAAGFPEHIDPFVRELARTARGADADDIRLAALVYRELTQASELKDTALAAARDSKERTSVRCRAVESLATEADDASLSVLLRALSSSEPELRRSGALALGTFASSLALPSLLTAYEHEKDHTTRGFVLLSVGQQGGDDARRFLTNVLQRGKRSSRPWAALALGLLSREHDDVAARAAIRAAAEVEKNTDHLGAYWIASGLARDRAALPVLQAVLTHSGNASRRVDACHALALIGGPEAREVLRSRLAVDPCVYTRLVIAEMLGYLGHGEDAQLVFEALLASKDPQQQESLALALGLSGDRRALAQLEAVVRDGDWPATVRAAALDSLGLLLSRRPPLVLRSTLFDANLATTPTWLGAAATLSL